LLFKITRVVLAILRKKQPDGCFFLPAIFEDKYIKEQKQPVDILCTASHRAPIEYRSILAFMDRDMEL